MAMQLTHETELMKNYKHAEVMSAGMSFAAIQSPEGRSIFFSIGTDRVLYATREVTAATTTGWTRTDLSSSLARDDLATMKAKSFALSQNPESLVFDLALVVTAGDSDYLFVSLGNANNESMWEAGVVWKAVPFDAAGEDAKRKLNITDLQVMNIPKPKNGGGGVERACFCDVQREPRDSLQLVDRYYIMSDAAVHWFKHQLPFELRSGSAVSVLGHRANEHTPGIYTLGVIGGDVRGAAESPPETLQLLYVPQRNPFRPLVPPNPARLRVPAKSARAFVDISAVAVGPDTMLFLAAAGGVYLFAAANQRDDADPDLVISAAKHPAFANIMSLRAASLGGTTVVWVLNTQRQLSYSTCPVGSEGDAKKWTAPVTILSDVQSFSFYLNAKTASNVLFAHLSGRDLVQLTHNSVTTLWDSRGILLPALKDTSVVEMNTFTTQLTTTDDKNTAAPNSAVSIEALSPANVFIDSTYFALHPGAPVIVTSDAVGHITIVEEAESLSAATSFRVTILKDGNPDVSIVVDPFRNAKVRLAAVKDGESLGKVRIKTVDGQEKSLVPPDVPQKDRDAVASSLPRFAQIATAMSPSAAPRLARAIAARDGENTETELPQVSSFGITFGKAGFTYVEHRGPERLESRIGGVGAGPETARASIVDGAVDLVVDIGDLFREAKNKWDQFESFVVQGAKDAWNFVVRIGGIVYRAIMETVDAVMGAVELVLSKIKVFFEDVIAWLGFLFDWDDILRTHSVMKHMFKLYADDAFNAIEHLKTSMAKTLDSAAQALPAAAGFKTNADHSVDTLQNGDRGASARNTPQANWGMFHLKSGQASATTNSDPPPPIDDTFSSLLANLKALALDEKEAITTAMDRAKEVLDNALTMNPLEILTKLLATVGSLVLTTTKNLGLAFLDAVQYLFKSTMATLDATLSIPVISWVYRKITKGTELSILDAACLVCAIPATLTSKLVTGATPFSSSLSRDLLATTTSAAFRAALASAPDSRVPAAHATASLFAGTASLLCVLIRPDRSTASDKVATGMPNPSGLKANYQRTLALALNLCYSARSIAYLTLSTPPTSPSWTHELTAVAMPMTLCLYALEAKLGPDSFGKYGGTALSLGVSIVGTVGEIGRAVDQGRADEAGAICGLMADGCLLVGRTGLCGMVAKNPFKDGNVVLEIAAAVAEVVGVAMGGVYGGLCFARGGLVLGGK
ncbi:hypothetical protein OQA88_5453 [Cercophora sp. LCS_1]